LGRKARYSALTFPKESGTGTRTSGERTFERHGRVSCGDATHLPYPDGSMDAVFMSFALELSIRRDSTSAGRVRARAAPGGRIGVVAITKEGKEGFAVKRTSGASALSKPARLPADLRPPGVRGCRVLDQKRDDREHWVRSSCRWSESLIGFLLLLAEHHPAERRHTTNCATTPISPSGSGPKARAVSLSISPNAASPRRHRYRGEGVGLQMSCREDFRPRARIRQLALARRRLVIGIEDFTLTATLPNLRQAALQ